MDFNQIRQQLLEEKKLDLVPASDLAKQPELTQKQSMSYFVTPPTSCFLLTNNLLVLDTPVDSDGKENPLSAVANFYYCAMSPGLRIKCPAKKALRKGCRKRGHFKRVWRIPNAGKSIHYSQHGTSSVDYCFVCHHCGGSPLQPNYRYPYRCQRNHTKRAHRYKRFGGLHS